MRFVVVSILISVSLIRKGTSFPATEGQSSLRIAGGEPADIKQYPYQVAISIDGGLCGGSILNERHILTAAHCVHGYQAFQVAVRAGSNYRDRNGELVSAESIFEHGSFDPETYDNDIAVIKLKSDLKFDDSVNAIALPPPDYQIKSDILAIVTGYGYVSDHGPLSTSLRNVQLPLITTDGCQFIYGEDQITSRMFCAGYDIGGKDACSGDSGGPLVLDDVVIGIVSFGPDCAAPGMPGAYTKVSAFRSFIDSVIDS